MAFYVTRAVSTTNAINTYANLVNDGTGTNVGAIQVPVGTTNIVEVLFSFAASTLTITSVGGDVFLRLTGNGLQDGQQELCMGGVTSLTTTSGALAFVSVLADVKTAIRTIVGNTITPAATQSGVKFGTQEYACTLVFQ